MAVYQICSRDNLDRKLQAQELARIMNERFVGLDVGLFPLCFFLYWQFINVTVFMPCSLNPVVFLGYVTSSPESRDYRVLTEKGRTKVRETVVFWSCSIGINCFWVFPCSIGKNLCLLGAFNQLFQLASNHCWNCWKRISWLFSCDCSERKDFSQELLRFNWKGPRNVVLKTVYHMHAKNQSWNCISGSGFWFCPELFSGELGAERNNSDVMYEFFDCWALSCK